MKDPIKLREKQRRYRERKKIEKYGPQAAGKNMSGRHGNHARGKRNARWQGGRWIHKDGYVAVAVPKGHHLRMKNGYAYVHQIVAELVIGRRLRKGETVHHINGDVTDNRPENLQVTTRRDHAELHAACAPRNALGQFMADLKRTPADLRVREFPAGVTP